MRGSGGERRGNNARGGGCVHATQRRTFAHPSVVISVIRRRWCKVDEAVSRSSWACAIVPSSSSSSSSFSARRKEGADLFTTYARARTHTHPTPPRPVPLRFIPFQLSTPWCPVCAERCFSARPSRLSAQTSRRGELRCKRGDGGKAEESLFRVSSRRPVSIEKGEKRVKNPLPFRESLDLTSLTVTSKLTRCARCARVDGHRSKHVDGTAGIQRAQQAEEEALPGEASEG